MGLRSQRLPQVSRPRVGARTGVAHSTTGRVHVRSHTSGDSGRLLHRQPVHMVKLLRKAQQARREFQPSIARASRIW